MAVPVYAIVAMDLAGTIGVDGKIPWHLRQDLRRFKELTRGSVLVMGRTTYETLPAPRGDGDILPGRKIVVLSSRLDKTRYKNVTVCTCAYMAGDVKKAVDMAVKMAEVGNDPKKPVFLCGGELVYTEGVTLCDSVFMTVVQTVVHGSDTRFPIRKLAGWKVQHLADTWADGADDFRATYLRFDNPCSSNNASP